MGMKERSKLATVLDLVGAHGLATQRRVTQTAREIGKAKRAAGSVTETVFKAETPTEKVVARVKPRTAYGSGAAATVRSVKRTRKP